MEKYRNIVITVPESNCSECSYGIPYFDGEEELIKCEIFDYLLEGAYPCEDCLKCTEKKNG